MVVYVIEEFVDEAYRRCSVYESQEAANKAARVLVEKRGWILAVDGLDSGVGYWTGNTKKGKSVVLRVKRHRVNKHVHSVAIEGVPKADAILQ